ncbi:hypothetical protein [Halorubrum sp. F4]|uniref:hypothetical protein n=1 Tax=Halorubrum sp. F4 TaxID=2989715 RepID=UPI002480C359|nr:hypothetical protein [Halorubrum sp. F4]
MSLPPIPAEYVITASFVGTMFIAYQSRLNGLERERDRDLFLNEKLAERTHLGDIWGITIDSVRFREKDGFLYRKWKFLTGRISGETTVVVRYQNTTIPGDFWDTPALQHFLDEFKVEVDHLQTDDHLDPTVARFKMETTDPDTIDDFFGTLITMEQNLR